MNNKPLRICFICSRLDLPGGIERAVVNTANLFSKNHHQVILLILDETNVSFYAINSNVVVKQYNLDFGIVDTGNMLTRKIRLLQQIFELRGILKKVKPDVIIGSEYHLTIAAYFAAKKLKAKVFAWEHHHFYWLKRSSFWQLLYQFVYKRLRAVICLNPLEESLHKSANHPTAVIPNFVERREPSNRNSKTLLTIGGLIKRKGVDRIPRIAEKIFHSHSDWQWLIIGRGPELDNLKRELDEKNLSSKVKILSPLSNELSAYYNIASIYVMTSRFECFPMVLLEAMAHGVPCVSFNCPTGPSSIIENGINGILVEQDDSDGMVRALNSLMSDEAKRSSQSKQAFLKILQWAPEAVYHQWEVVLKMEKPGMKT